jgi:hypothetical protein
MKKNDRVLWVFQSLLAALFLFAGGTKLVMPIDQLVAQSHMSGGFLRFIGVVEVLGGLGLVLPGLTGIAPILTPLAAAGLVIVMIGATVVSLPGGVLAALIPFVVGVLAAWVAVRRWRFAPGRSTS